MRSNAIFYLNGKRVEAGAEHAFMMLSDYLRYERGLRGTKVVCAEGDCGACSVLRLFQIKDQGENYFVPVNACITSVAQMDGSSLVTIDALGESFKNGLTPVQESMLVNNGSQCGFCTPGFVIAMSGLVEKKLCAAKKANTCLPQETRNALTGNLCRCTGYQPILDAACTLELKSCKPLAQEFYSKPQAAELRKALREPLLIEAKNVFFAAPTSLKEASKILASAARKSTSQGRSKISAQEPLRIIGASTDLGVVHNKYKLRLNRMLSLHLIPDLHKISKTSKRMKVGARVTLSQLREACKVQVPEFARFLDLFASPQIKNVATLVGNVANASPIGDTPPFLLVSDALVNLWGPRGKRSVPLKDFYLGYRKTDLKAGEFISSIEFDIPQAEDILSLRKISQRKDLDISCINMAFKLRWQNSQKTIIASLKIALGGVAATPLLLNKVDKALKGKEATETQLAQALTLIHNDIKPLSDLRGSASFRRILVENLFWAFFESQGLTRQLKAVEQNP